MSELKNFLQDPHYINKVVTKLFPTKRNQLLSLENIRVLDNETNYYGKQGLYVVRDNSNPSDKNGWIVIHYPTLVRKVLQNPTLPAHLVPTAEKLKEVSTTLLDDTELLFSLERSWRQHMLTQWFPPGASVWSDATTFRSLLTPVLEHLIAEQIQDVSDLNPDEWLVARPGELMTWGKSVFPFDVFKPFRNLPMFALPDIKDGIPNYITLLLFALARSRLSGKGYEDWGVGWIDEGLYFNHYRAFQAMRRDKSLSEMFPGDDFEDYLGPWSTPAYFERYPKYSALPRLSIISSSAEEMGARLHTMLAPYSRIHGDSTGSFQYIPQWSTEHARIFNINPNRNDTLNRYLKDLHQISAATLGSAEKKPGFFRPKERSVNFLVRRNMESASAQEIQNDAPNRFSRYRDYNVFTVNAFELGWFDKPTDDANFVMGIMKTHGTYYMSPPTIFLETFPELMDGTLFERSGRTEDMHMVDTSTYTYNLSVVKRLKFNRKIPYLFKAHKMNYLHPLMFDPSDGEFWQVVSMITDTYRDVRGKNYASMLAAFKSFCMWLFQPYQIDKNVENPTMFVGSELQYLSDPTSDCPVQLKTLDDRLGFFWDKAIKLKEKHVAFEDDSTLKHGARREYSPRLGPYDQWCLWYCASHELPSLGVKLNDIQQAEYITKRWLPWRRIAGIRLKLHRVQYQFDFRGPTPPYKDSIDNLVEKANEKFGRSYSVRT